MKLLIILGLIGILFIQGCSEENYEPIVYNRTKLLNCNQNFSDEIPNMVHSTELIINKFKRKINKEIIEEFRPHFFFYPKNGFGIKAKILYSTFKEAIIEFELANSDSIIIECTPFPIQIVKSTGIGKPDNGTRENVKLLQEVIATYDSLNCLFALGNNIFTISRLTIEAYKPFCLSKNSIVILNDFRFTGSSDRSTDIGNWAILSVDNSLWNIRNNIESIIDKIFETELFDLINSDEFFRLALMEKDLEPHIIKRRKSIVEHPFGTMKKVWGLFNIFT